jgi:hypothetical protein
MILRRRLLEAQHPSAQQSPAFIILFRAVTYDNSNHIPGSQLHKSLICIYILPRRSKSSIFFELHRWRRVLPTLVMILRADQGVSFIASTVSDLELGLASSFFWSRTGWVGFDFADLGR